MCKCKCFHQVSISPCSPVTKPVCGEWPVSCFLLSCQLSGQTKRTRPVTKRGGIYGSMQAGGRRTPPASIPQPFPQPPSKECHRSLCVNRQPAVWDVRQNRSHVCISFTSTKIPKPLLARHWHPRLNRMLTCVYTCLAISSWTLLFKLEHELIVHISLAPDCGWPVSSTDTFHFVRLRQR